MKLYIDNDNPKCFSVLAIIKEYDIKNIKIIAFNENG